MSRSSKAQRARQKDRASVAAGGGGAADAEPKTDDCAETAAVDVGSVDIDDTEGVLDCAKGDTDGAEERSNRDTASDVCTRSESASHIIRSDSNSKYDQDSACNPALLSAGRLNLMLVGKL